MEETMNGWELLLIGGAALLVVGIRLWIGHHDSH
jgi:hypothetical protein